MVDENTNEFGNKLIKYFNHKLFDRYIIDDNNIKIGDHFLVDLYANEIWEVKRTKNKNYIKKRKQWLDLKPIEFIINSEDYGSPNNYWNIKLKKILRGRDDLNSNKTLKEFCKNKKELEEKNL